MCRMFHYILPDAQWTWHRWHILSFSDNTKFRWGNVWHPSSNLQAQITLRSWWPGIWILDISTHQVSSHAVLTSKCFSQRSFLQLKLVMLIKLKEIGTWLFPSICCLYRYLSVWKVAQFIILLNWMNLMTPRSISLPLNLPDTYRVVVKILSDGVQWVI